MTINVLHCKITSYERKLLELIEEVGYGEIYAVEQPPDPLPHLYEMEISDKTASFLKLVRQGETFDKVVIHDSEPSIAEKQGHLYGFRCLKKIKF